MSSNYYVPEESKWPVISAASLLFMFIAVSVMLGQMGSEAGISTASLISVFVGLGLVIYTSAAWFADVINESETGKNNKQMGITYRQGMVWFIAGEAALFATLFGSFFYARYISVPWIGGLGDKAISGLVLWPDFKYQWPLLEAPNPEVFSSIKAIIDPFHIPLLNTLLLVTSSFTVSFAHKYIVKLEEPGYRQKAINWLIVSLILGFTFAFFQAYEYYAGYAYLDLRLDSNVYGSLFYMLTGFHGLHVIIGALMLLIMTIRLYKGHFTSKNHFGFEASAWYWHFVDVVWIGLFIFVYLV